MFNRGSILLLSGRSACLKSIFRNQCGIEFSSCKTLSSKLTPKSHPHLLSPEEISPLLKKDVYQRRRSEFLKKTRYSSQENSVPHLLLIPSSSTVYMTENIPYRFRQQTDFYYLSGLKEPNCVLLMSTQDNQDKTVLFVPKPTPVSERWEGVQMSLSDTTEFFSVDQTFYLNDLETYLQTFIKLNDKFKFWYDFSYPCVSAVQQIVRDFIRASHKSIMVDSPRNLIHSCRVIKSPEEVEVMKQTCRIGAESLKEVIRFSKSCNLESLLEAKMNYECCFRGADHLAFPPVVAGGARANTIHYIDNNQTLKADELVLMDAGCEFGGYCSDLARTWPMNGKFSDPQRKLYDLILSIQEQLIDMVVKKPSLDHLFNIMCDELGKGLQDLGIIPLTISKENIAQEAFDFCPHHVSHYLGMDVHDTSTISRSIKLLPGMVVTVEPGVYISKDNLNVPEQYRGICIRIEDDVLITETGYEVLTSDCPKNMNEIENLMT